MGEGRIRVIRGVALAIGAMLAWLEWQASPNADRTVLAFDVAVGLTFIVAAVITLGVPTARRIAYLDLAAGLAWFVGALAPVASGLYLGFLVHLLVTYPTGRLERMAQRAVVATGYGVALIASPLGFAGVDSVLLAAVAVTSMVAAYASDGPMRRGRLGAAVVAATMGVVLALIAAGVAAGTLDFATGRILSASLLILSTAALAIDLRWGGWSRDALTRLVIDLGIALRRPRCGTASRQPLTTRPWSSGTRSTRVGHSLTMTADRSSCHPPDPDASRCHCAWPGLRSACSYATNDGPSIQSWPMALRPPPSLRWTMPDSTMRPGVRSPTSRRPASDSSRRQKRNASESAASSRMEPCAGSLGCASALTASETLGR